MMKKLVCGLLVAGSFGFGLLWAADAFSGTWKLNVTKSKFSRSHEIKEETATITEQGENRVVTVKGMTGADKPISVKYSSPANGGTVTYTEGSPLAGAGAVVVVKKIDANTVDATATLNGKQVGTTHSVISADGKTLRQTQSYTDADGKTWKNTLVFERQ